MFVQPVTLNGQVVRLEPLKESHVPDLAYVGKEKSIWKYLPYGNITTEGKMLDLVRTLLKRAEQGVDLPFAVIHKETNRAIGCTRYLDINRNHKSLEIGGTWYGVKYQKTAVNTESKYLLLEHAFENLGCIRVQFKTDARNTRSQKAIERIMAVKEGILRNHMILPGGEVRDSVYYSIISSEWPCVKERLEEKLSQRY